MFLCVVNIKRADQEKLCPCKTENPVTSKIRKLIIFSKRSSNNNSNNNNNNNNNNNINNNNNDNKNVISCNNKVHFL